MTARDELRKYANLLADSWTPRERTDERVEWLYQNVRAEVLAEAADQIDRVVAAEPTGRGTRGAWCRGLAYGTQIIRDRMATSPTATPAPETAVEYGIAVNNEYGQRVLDPSTDLAGPLARLARCQDMWPNSRLVQRITTYGEWTDATALSE